MLEGYEGHSKLAGAAGGGEASSQSILCLGHVYRKAAVPPSAQRCHFWSVTGRKWISAVLFMVTVG